MSNLTVSNTDLKQRILSVIGKADFGLANVDNTSDSSKPVSTAQQTALNLKVDKTSVNAASGVAGLDASSKISSNQLPALGLSTSLNDVQISSAANAQVLTYDNASGKWKNATSSGGSANLTQNEIVIGVGESTTSPQTVTLRGPQATGTNVQAGDIVIRAEGGTGSCGSGKIRFQTSAAATPYPIAHYKFSTTTASATSTIYIPTGFSNVLALLCVHSQTTSDAVTTMSLGGSALTSAFSTTSAAVGFIKFAYLINPTAGTLATITVNFSAAGTYNCNLLLFENAISVSDGVSQTIANGTLSTVTVPNMIEGDMAVDCSAQRNTNIGSSTYTIPSTQSLISGIYYGPGATSTVFTWTTSTNVVGGATTMSRGYTTSVPALMAAVRVQMYRTASSTSPTFTDSLIITNTGRIYYPLSLPTFAYETFQYGSTSTRYLTPTSPRVQILKNTTGTNKTIVLPRADLLPLGTTFVIDGSSGTDSIYISPRYGGYGNAVYSSGFNSTSYGNTLGVVQINSGSVTTMYSTIGGNRAYYVNSGSNYSYTCQLISNEGAGIWTYTASGTTIPAPVI